MKLVTNREHMADILLSNISTQDMEYYNTADQEIMSFLESSDSEYYRYDKIDFYTKSISDLLYLVFERFEEYFLNKYGVKININLIIKPVTVFYVVFNIVFYIRRKGLNIEDMTDFEVEDIVIDALNYSGFSEFLIDAIGFIGQNKINEVIEDGTVNIVSPLRQVIRVYLEKFLLENLGFLKLAKELEDSSGDVFLLMKDMLLLPRNNNININELLHMNPYDILLLDKSYLVDVVVVKAIIVGEANEEDFLRQQTL